METVTGRHLEKSVGTADTLHSSEWDRKATRETVIRARSTLPECQIVSIRAGITGCSIQHTCDTWILAGLTGHIAQEETVHASCTST